MSTTPDPIDDEPATRTDESTRGGSRTVSDRYTGLEFEHGDVVIYDQECTEAWIQSTNAVPADRIQ